MIQSQRGIERTDFQFLEKQDDKQKINDEHDRESDVPDDCPLSAAFRKRAGATPGQEP